MYYTMLRLLENSEIRKTSFHRSSPKYYAIPKGPTYIWENFLFFKATGLTPDDIETFVFEMKKTNRGALLWSDGSTIYLDSEGE